MSSLEIFYFLNAFSFHMTCLRWVCTFFVLLNWIKKILFCIVLCVSYRVSGKYVVRFFLFIVFYRVMWSLSVLTCIIAVVLQIVDRVQHYYSWPLSVNVKINYNQTLDFPAVTVCNQNAFRYDFNFSPPFFIISIFSFIVVCILQSCSDNTQLFVFAVKILIARPKIHT